MPMNTATRAIRFWSLSRAFTASLPSVTVKKLGVNDEKSEVTVGFDKALNAAGIPIDTERELWELTVMYGGIAKRIQTLDKNGKVVDEAAFTFRDNGTYTFKVYDDEGAYAYVTVEISEIDSKAPVIKSFSWSYDYDILENGTWQTKTEAGTIEIGVDTSGTESGYILSTAGKTEADKMPVTNGDVTVTVVTDEPTRTLGSNEEDYTTDAEKVFDDNGMYIFDREKNNRLTDSYAIDVELIDKTPPVLLLASDELVFYENADVGEPFNLELLTKPGTAFSAYDLFRGKTDLSDEVEVIIDPRLNTTDFAANTFDRSIAYTVTYRVSDRAHNVTEAVRTIRLVGYVRHSGSRERPSAGCKRTRRGAGRYRFRYACQLCRCFVCPVCRRVKDHGRNEKIRHHVSAVRNRHL